MKPNSKNFCGGSFQDWLEVNLIEQCNGRCSWCVEKKGYHPKEHASWETIVQQAISSGKTNIILLGGEPTLHKDLRLITKALVEKSRKVWITTNGKRLTPGFVAANLVGITGINISIHSDDLAKNEEITGVKIQGLRETIMALHTIGASVRLNCNCISGYIDSEEAIRGYITFAKRVGADKVRFAELKHDDKFVDLAKILDHRFGLNDNPFVEGCNNDTVIDNMSVNFRQLCGLQTPKREKPENPEMFAKRVLYYDGKFYDGWLVKESVMTHQENLEYMIKKILADVQQGVLSPEKAHEMIMREIKPDGDTGTTKADFGAGCAY